jgi:hypothetical protein
MGMDWLRGLVGASDQMVPPGQPIPGAYGAQPFAPPQGGYAPPGPAGAQAFGGPPAGPAPQAAAAPWTPPSDPSTWGTPGGYPPPQGWPAQPAPAAPQAAPAAPAAAAAPADARVAQLEKDVHNLALFARALLLLLEERGVATEPQFQAALAKLQSATPAS